MALLGFFVVALDSQVVNVAPPSIRHDLGGGLAGLQWIVTGYTLMFSARFGLRVPVGVSGSFTAPRVTSLLLERIPAARAGTARGVLNMSRQMGRPLGGAAGWHRALLTGFRWNSSLALASARAAGSVEERPLGGHGPTGMRVAWPLDG